MNSRYKNLISRIDDSFRSRLGIRPTWVTSKLLNKEYTVRKHTIRREPDYDDAWLLALAGQATLTLDIGSNIGQAAFIILHPSNTSSVILIDPNPCALAVAAENLIYNHLAHRARFVCALALNRDNEEVDFWTIGIGSAGSIYTEQALSASKLKKKFKVPTITVDSLCKRFSIVPDLVKIDTEGAEVLVLQGSGELAIQGQTRFFVEMHSDHKPMKDNAQDLLDWCARVDYKAWYLSEKTELIMADQIRHRGRCHLLLQPSSRKFPEILKGINQGDELDSVRLSPNL